MGVYTGQTLGTRTLHVQGKSYQYYALPALAEKGGFPQVARLPYAIKVLLENLVRHADGQRITEEDIRDVAAGRRDVKGTKDIPFTPARVLMQDFTGVPSIVDLAAMRDAMATAGQPAEKINPLVPVDLVIDHSVMVDYFSSKDAFERNVHMEFQRNQERYAFLKWGQQSFENFRVVPPGTGICHQVNLEYLSKVVWVQDVPGAAPLVFPDTVLGTDSHTPMVNGLSVLGWGVGGIEAEAVILGQPLSMLMPEVVGFQLTGKLAEGVTATDLVLTITNILRTKGVVGKFVEFFGPGLDHLSLADRATISNMAPEYGATCGFFPIDKETLRYLTFTGRDEHHVALVEAYAKAQGLWRDDAITADYDEILQLDLVNVEATLAGPKRPQDKILLRDAKAACVSLLNQEEKSLAKEFPVKNQNYTLHDGAVVIAAITSCTNTSNPAVMLGAGLLARKAHALGLKPKPWVKTSLAPGSQVVTDYLEKSGLMRDLEALGFDLVGYGCTTCIGNSGPLPSDIAQCIDDHNVSAAGVLSGNRNFEGRINPHLKLSYLASPPLVVAYALAGTMLLDLTTEPLGTDTQGKPVYLKDIWPTSQEIETAIASFLTPEMFRQRYRDVFKGDEQWQQIQSTTQGTFQWDPSSTYIKNPPYFQDFELRKTDSTIKPIQKACILALLGDSVTTDHISPAGAIQLESPAGRYLMSCGVEPRDFNSYGSRRGNHEVMMRGTFANIRLINNMIPEKPGGYTRIAPDAVPMTIYKAAMAYQAEDVPLVVFAGKEYGTGSSRDWAAKGPALLGIRAIIAESFERIHRANLIGMGVLPLQFINHETHKTLGLTGFEHITIPDIDEAISAPNNIIPCHITDSDGVTRTISLRCRLDTPDEISYFRHGGILQFVLRQLASASEA